MHCTLFGLIATALLAGAAGCQGVERPAGPQLRDSPRSAAHEELISVASRSTALLEEIAILQQAGWTGGDFAQARSLGSQDGKIAIALAFGRPVDSATLDLLYAPDGDSVQGGSKVFVRPHDAASAAALSRSLDHLNQDGEEAGDNQGEPVTAPAPTEGVAPAGDSAPAGSSPTLYPLSVCGHLTANQSLGIGQSLWACHNGYHLVMQADGNLVAYTGGGKVVWATHTNGKGGHHVTMQADGNLVLYTSGGRALWSSRTYGRAGAYFRLQDDGNLVVYTSGGSALWSSGTYCTGCSGGACRLWRCSYTSSAGVSPACIGIPDEINLIGRYHYRDVRSGHTDPASCVGLYRDYLGNGKACPVPNSPGSVFTCGAP